MNWKLLAACRDMDLDEFFPIPEPKLAETWQLELCANCPVSRHCYDWAMHNEAFGIWAGTTSAQRFKYRKRQGWRLKPTLALTVWEMRETVS